jgi:hypothetical protein
MLDKDRYKVEGIGWKVKKEDIRLTAHDARRRAKRHSVLDIV